MSKKTLILLYILTLISLSLVGGIVFEYSNQSVINIQADTAVSSKVLRLDTYDMWGYVINEDHQNPQKLQAALQILAKRDNVSYTESIEYINDTANWSKLTPGSLKNINPALKAYRTYDLISKPNWDTDWNNPNDTSHMNLPLPRQKLNDPNNVRGGQFDANATDDWWLRDAKNQVVIENGAVWLVDPGRPGFKEAFTAAIISRNAGKGFDGMVFDYWFPNIEGLITLDKFTAPAYRYANDSAWYTQAWQPFIQYLTTNLHNAGYRIIGNCAGQGGTSDPYQQWQRSKIDGTIYEQWSVGWPQDGGGWLPSQTVAERIDAFNNDPMEAWTADYGLQSTFPDFAQKNLAGLAMYYIAIPKDSSKRSFNYYNQSIVYWDPLWDFYIGTPITASPAKDSNKYFWSRSYTQGLVLLNYDTTAISYSLSGKYVDNAGKQYSGTISLPSHTGLILKTVAASAPTSTTTKKPAPKQLKSSTGTTNITPSTTQKSSLTNNKPSSQNQSTVANKSTLEKIKSFFQELFSTSYLIPITVILTILLGLIVLTLLYRFRNRQIQAAPTV